MHGVCRPVSADLSIDVINVYNVYKKIFVNAFIILSTHTSETKQNYDSDENNNFSGHDNPT